MDKKLPRATWLIVALSTLFLFIAGFGLYCGSRYIDNKLLHSCKSTASDVALLVKNNFSITDEEVKYMKSLTFNEMEVDPINRRLMNIVNGLLLNTDINNVYLLAPLAEDEYRYCPNEETAEFLGFEMNQPLNAMWLLNGKFNTEGYFEVAQRDDIYRYTVLEGAELNGMRSREAFGTLTNDAWGSFITGYAPIYTTAGSFVGLLGIDMDPDPYQNSAQHMILLIIILFAVTVVLMLMLFLVFYLKYVKALEGKRQFEFYSKMSHEMRTPMNGILGTAAVSKNETDVSVLHHNIAQIESSGTHLLELINETLDYKKRGKDAPSKKDFSAVAPSDPCSSYRKLKGRRLLLCEDNMINAEITQKLVEAVGCTIEVTENGQLGLERFESSPEGYFDAILMDIHMPVMGGIEATRRIRALKRGDAQSVPIIALTANSYEEDKKATMDAGMNAHLTKPVDPPLLYQTLLDTISARKKSGVRRKRTLK